MIGRTSVNGGGNSQNRFGRPSDLADQIRGFFIAASIAAGISEILGSFAASTWAASLRFIVLNLMLGGAAGLSGGVLGFIFGIPRSLTDDRPPPANNGNTKSRPNTNLEQISDWLTKILVGATLTSLANIPHALIKMIAFLDAGQYKDLPGGGTLAIFIVIYFAMLGFFWSYVETRTLITDLFDDYSIEIPTDAILKVRSAPWEPGSDPIPEDAEVLKLDVSNLTTSPILEARAAAETRAGNYDNAVKFYQAALLKDPGNPRLQGRLVLLLARTGKVTEADSLTASLKGASGDNTAQRNQIEASKVYTALYKSPPNGFEEAIRIGEPLLAGDQASNAQLQLWMACAYGQRLAARLGGSSASSPTIDPNEPDRKRALACLAEVKRLRPDLLMDARALWRPNQFGKDPSENDLEIFRNDSEFDALLQP